MNVAPDAPQDEVDVAIVGGGVGGCYLGYRLLAGVTPHGHSPLAALRQGREQLRVGLYESTGRLGGRLWSVRLPGLPDVAADLGGMRFHDQLHLVADLIQHLGLADQVTDFSFGQPENFAYLRGKRFRQRELETTALARSTTPLPYRLRTAERLLGPSGLEQHVTDTALPGFSGLRARYHAAFERQSWEDVTASEREYTQRKAAARIDGAPLHALSWRTLLGQVLGQEAIQLVKDAGGYDNLAENGNIADWLDVLFHAPIDGRYRRLRGGFDALPLALHARYRAAGGTTWPHHHLRRLDRHPGAGDMPAYTLRFAAPEGGRSRRVKARCVLLALPQHALESLDPDSFLFEDAALNRNLRGVRAVPAVKLFLAYPSPWWEQTGVSRGRSTTDLPLRQLWYWAGGDTRHPPAVLLASYTSGTDAAYWSRLRAGELYPDSKGPLEAPALPADAPASRQMVERAHAMLLEFHGVEDAPWPVAARCQDWSDAPHGGGWHVWREHHVSGDIIPAMRKPLADEQVFIVSDCWSHDPGSVHGTLATAECTLQDHLGLGWPGWLRHEGTRLGPRGTAKRIPSRGGV
nr:FAD-dependent oxidoreductase [Myxococcus sp. AM009]